MRTHFMLALAGLLMVTSPVRSEGITSTAEVTAHYKDTWFASDAEKARCADRLQAFAGDDLEAAKKQGVAIDDMMRSEKCLDGYSYIYGHSTLPIASARLDTPSVDAIGSYLFIYINTFENKADDLIAKLKKLDEQAVEAVTTVVIDVRGNGGGYVESLKNVLDESFSPEPGLRFLQLSGKASYGTFYTTSRKGIFAGRKIVILVDPQTASSSEWLVEILCYEWYPNTCTTLGVSPTYGKSILQCIYDGKTMEIKLTCGEWFLVNKRTHEAEAKPQRVQGVGIKPDKPMAFSDCDRFAYTCIAAELAEAGL